MNYVLLMVLGWQFPTPGGFSTIQQEFTSLQKCEKARQEMSIPAPLSPNFIVLAHGCFAK
jgi:hypothetical protein